MTTIKLYTPREAAELELYTPAYLNRDTDQDPWRTSYTIPVEGCATQIGSETTLHRWPILTFTLGDVLLCKSAFSHDESRRSLNIREAQFLKRRITDYFDIAPEETQKVLQQEWNETTMREAQEHIREADTVRIAGHLESYFGSEPYFHFDMLQAGKEMYYIHIL